MIENIEVDAFVKVLGDDSTGMSKPVHVIGSNGKEYILKNQNVYVENSNAWTYWDCMFLQEVLVYNIANHLGISVPECAIADVDDVFISQAPALRFKHRYVPGYHFASQMIEGIENNLISGYLNLISLGKPYIKRSWNSFFGNISNKEDISKIIALDLLTGNFDRFGNIGNLLIATNNGNRLVYCIDHGHCFFGPTWADMKKKDMLISVSPTDAYLHKWIDCLMSSTGHLIPMSGLGEVFRALDQFVDVSDPDNHCFRDIVYRIEQLTPSVINSWFSGIPDEWFVDKLTQISIYTHFIMQQKNLIRGLIMVMAKQGAFQSYLGGEFSWKENRTGTQ